MEKTLLKLIITRVDDNLRVEEELTTDGTEEAVAVLQTLASITNRILK